VGLAILVACGICIFWLVDKGWPWVESKIAQFVAWQREGRDIDRQVAEEAAELDDEAALDRWLREGGETV
jgi:hypothetical protein